MSVQDSPSQAELISQNGNPSRFPAPGVRSRHMTGTVFDADDLLDDRPEVLAARGAEDSGDIFPNEVSRSDKVIWYTPSFLSFPHLLYNAYLVHEQAGAFPRKPPPLAGHRQILAGAAPADDMDRRQLRAIQLCDIPCMDHAWEPYLCHLHGECFNLARPYRHDAVIDSG